jgi:hypothetical protein
MFWIPMTSLALPIEQAQKHRQALLSQQRCSECAEQIPPSIILTGGSCPECEFTLGDSLADEAMSVLRTKWKRQRWMVYLAVGALSFFTGLFPMLQSLAMLIILVFLHLKLIRGPLRWLSRSRRVTARFSIKILAAGIVCFNLVCNVLVIPFVGASALVLAALSVFQVVLYCEGSLKLIDTRLEWERNGESLKVREWLFPTVLMGGTLAMVAMGLVLASLVLYGLTQVDIPGVTEIARFILDTDT